MTNSPVSRPRSADASRNEGPAFSPGLPLSERDWEDLRNLLNLSPREMEISLFVLQGCNKAKIASMLRCSPHTVHTHLRRAYLKLGVSKRSGLVARLFEGYVEITSQRRREDPDPNQGTPFRVP